MNEAELILFLAKAWGIIGAVVAVPFLTFGIDRLDEDARGAYIFRPLLVPGVLLIWPMVLWRWYVLATGKENWSKRYRPRRATHRWFAFAMPVVIVVVIVTGLSLRQTWPADVAPVQLTEAPE